MRSKPQFSLEGQVALVTAASKGIGEACALALEWARYNISVNAVAPTFIRTPGTRKWLGDPAFRASVLKRIPSGGSDCRPGWRPRW